LYVSGNDIMNEQQTLKIYHIAKRVTPFTPPSIEGDFISGTSKVFNENKIDVRVFLPRYGYISERKFILREVIRLKEIPVETKEGPLLSSVKSAFIPESRVQVYFNVFPDLYRDISKQVTSNYMELKKPDVYRAFLMCNFASLNTLERLFWQPDVILCYNWHTAMISLLIKAIYRDHDLFKNVKVVTVLSQDEPFYTFPEEILKAFDLKDQVEKLTLPAGYLAKVLNDSDGIIRLKSNKEDKLGTLLKEKELSKILSDKKEHSRIFNINSSTDTDNTEYWGPIAKELYEFLDKL
jgi:starch synthase